MNKSLYSTFALSVALFAGTMAVGTFAVESGASRGKAPIIKDSITLDALEDAVYDKVL